MIESPDRSAVALAAAVREGTTSAVEVVMDCLDRIADDDGVLHAWVHVDPDLALAQARELDRCFVPRGPLHGVPVGVKDIIDTADQPTEHGSSIYAGNRPERDAAVVRRLRDAGAVILGKTVSTEFALFQPGPTVNPLDHTRTPGGSSSGSAAAVAAGHVPLAVGTQTAGSVVRPASFCGVFGAKPTVGTVPLDGVKLCSSSLDTVGLFGANVDDLVLGLTVMSRHMGRFEPADEPEPLRIGFCRTPWWDAVAPGAAAAIEAAVDRLAEHLAIEEVELPIGFDGLVDAQVTVMCTELLDELAWEIEHRWDDMSEGLRRTLDSSRGRTRCYHDALAVRDRCRRRLPEVFEEVDVLLAPSVVGEPPAIATTGDPLLCRAWTLLGTPTVAVPGLRGPEGLPLGLQTIAPIGRDDRALTAAATIGGLLSRQ